MKIIDLQAIDGPNVFTCKPVMIATINLEDLAAVESSSRPDFIEHLVKILPGLRHHRCSKEREGGFIERLQTGTYFGHILEHVVLELSEFVGCPAYFGKTVYGGQEGVYKIAVEYSIAAVTKFLFQTALEFVETILQDEVYPLDEKLQIGRDLTQSSQLGPSTQAIIEAAKQKNVPWRRLNDQSLVQLGHGKHVQYIVATETWNTRSVAVAIACDKGATKALLKQACIPVPWGIVTENVDEAIAFQKRVGQAVVIKPLDGNKGRGVSMRLTSAEEIKQAFTLAQNLSAGVIVEEMYTGKDYRILVVKGKMIAASERVPPKVIGNGVHKLSDLIAQENASEWRGVGHEKPMTQIPVDAITLRCIAEQGLDLDSIPEKGREVILRDNANLSTGGSARDVTEAVHPSIKRICERAVECVGLDVGGVDLICEDITMPLTKNAGIVEVNASPGIRMHHFPSQGKPRDVGKAILDSLYPQHNGRIPIVAITGTNGKTTTTRLVAHIFASQGLKVGKTTTDGIWIGDEQIMEGDTTGPLSARAVLSNPNVEMAVLETARGGIVRNGLGYDWSKVGIITNIQSDHIGQDGIENEDDLLHIKSLVAERVEIGGTVVLNADDEKLVEFAHHPRFLKIPRKLVYFAVDGANQVLREHVEHGGTAYYVKRDWLVENVAGTEFFVAPLQALPLFHGYAIGFQLENVLAAVACARSFNVELMAIGAALKTFVNEQHNPGRANLFKLKNSYVLLDYGHNPASFAAVSGMVKQWSKKVIAVVGVPGDRCDKLVMEAGMAASLGFDELIFKEDKDRRGRDSGVIADLLYKGAKIAQPDRSCRIILDESEAVQKAIEQLKQDTSVVIFYDKLAPILAELKAAGAIPVSMPMPRQPRPQIRSQNLSSPRNLPYGRIQEIHGSV